MISQYSVDSLDVEFMAVSLAIEADITLRQPQSIHGVKCNENKTNAYPNCRQVGLRVQMVIEIL